MNYYVAQSIARQRMEETARQVEFAHHAPRPEPRSHFPRISWQVVRHPRVARA